MPIPEDEKFEKYLKQFRPVQPDSIPRFQHLDERRSWRPRIVWAAVAAMVLIVGAVVLSVHPRHPGVVALRVNNKTAFANGDVPPEPLTIRSANAWLAQAPSFKAGIDTLAFRSQNQKIQQGEQSAIAVLSKEKIKL